MSRNGFGVNAKTRKYGGTGLFRITKLLLCFALILFVASVFSTWEVPTPDEVNPESTHFDTPIRTQQVRRVEKEIRPAPKQSGRKSDVPHLQGATSLNIPELDKKGQSMQHFIFYTDCSSEQHWQSYVLFHSAYKTGQPGLITRIVAGCNDEEAKSIRTWHGEMIHDAMSDRFRLHVAEKCPEGYEANSKRQIVDSKGCKSKPKGILDWLENGNGNNMHQELLQARRNNEVVALIDSASIFLRPIRFDSKIFDQFTMNSANVSEAHSEQKDNYRVGPYITTIENMRKISQTWIDYLPQYYRRYPKEAAEDVAFAVATAHAALPHQRLDSFVVSDVKDNRGWQTMEQLPAKHVCTAVKSHINGHSSDPSYLPHLMNYNQRYNVGRWFFHKDAVRTDFLSCDSAFLEIPLDDIGYKYDFKIPPLQKRKVDLPPKEARREAFMLCGIVSALNAAGIFFKTEQCRV